MAFPSLLMMLKAWLCLFSLATTVFAQTFPQYPINTTWPGLSPACLSALNTSVACSYLLPVSTEKTTNEFCDVIFSQWLNQQPQRKLTTEQECSDCILGVSQLQLNSPFGYDDDSASIHTSLTSSCSKPVGYGFTLPPPYTPAATATTTATGASSSASPTGVLDPGCVSLYTTQANDTCNSIAVSQNVSTFAVYGSSGLWDQCSSLPTGTKLCLLSQCVNYQVQQGDTCDGIIAAAGLTVSPSMFVAWNPNINVVCSNLLGLVGDYICLSRPDGLLTPNITLPSAAVPATATAWPTFVPTPTPQLPLAPGTVTGCTSYRNYKDTTVYDNFYQPKIPLDTDLANNCYFVAAFYDITFDQLQAWNPSLNGTDTSNCTFAAGYSYCVENGNTPLPGPTDLRACLDTDPTLIPSSTIATYDCFTEIKGYDNGSLDCTLLTHGFDITVENLQTWNPWLAGDLATCDTALYIGLGSQDTRQVCVGNGTVTSTASSSTTGPTSTTSSLSSKSSSTVTPLTSTSTSTTQPPTISTTTSTTAPATSSPGSVCILGTDTGNPNQTGLCSFACHYGYCPPGPCVCTAYGAQVAPPPNTGVAGFKLAWEDSSYVGLCSYVYDHGYYPTGACTTNADGSPQV
ncbi:hypothetical protein B0T19DRAFT_439410 [Cercophora scortea]|uniref:LysM domain-containing protein n=1 Tax=Cercophora scortea TaxID=314031 RepID=A0AAE0MHP4_9PEZI|nr:hypothetical protein B0T19DRAFT_439410 [Cercophora scortea]